MLPIIEIRVGKQAGNRACIPAQFPRGSDDIAGDRQIFRKRTKVFR